MDSDARVTQNVVELNTTKANLEAVFLSCKNKFAEVDMQRTYFENYSQKLTDAMNETSSKNNADTDAKFKVLTAELNAYAASMETRLAAEFESTKKFVTQIKDRIRRTRVAGGTARREEEQVDDQRLPSFEDAGKGQRTGIQAVDGHRRAATRKCS